MGRLKAALALITWALCSQSGWAALNPSEVPFELFRGYVIVAHGSVGNLKNLAFLIDTGAVPTVLDERIAHKLQLRSEGEQIDVFTKKLRTKRAIAADLRLGPLHAAELQVVILDLSFEQSAVGTRVDAIIGFDLLSQAPFTIDYESRKISVGPIDTSLTTIPYLLICLLQSWT